MNLVKPLLRHAKEQPDKLALFFQGERRTYFSLVERVKKVAHGLKKSGLEHDKVAILSSNRIEFVEVFLGAVYAGCVPVPLDPKWSPNEVNAILKQCQPKMIFVESFFAKDIRLSRSEAKILTFATEKEGSYESWLSSLKPEAEMDETNELLFIGFTSGTTGMPKGYMRTHLSWIKSFEATSEGFGLGEMEHIIAPGPFVHSLSLFALIQSLYSGATFHIVQKFHPTEVLQLCKQNPGVILFVVPTMIKSMLEQAKPEKTHVRALISSGAKWSEESKKRAREVFGEAKLYEFYGSSEASYISYLDADDDHKSNSVGKPFSGVRISIRDEHFKEVPRGMIGQLYIQSDMMFLGYHHLPDETTATFKDDWLILGDYVYMDHDDYLYIAGRVKNRIITGGLNVFPEEVESVLQQNSVIEEVMVLGVPDDYWGEQVVALVKWKGQQHLSEELKHYCRHNLASYKVPKQIITIDQFTYTSSGKIARKAMEDYLKRVIV